MRPSNGWHASATRATTSSNELTEARGKLDHLGSRAGELEQLLVTQTREAESLNRRVQELETKLTDQGRVLAERDYQVARLRSEVEGSKQLETDLRNELSITGTRSGQAADKFRSDIGQLETQLAAALGERNQAAERAYLAQARSGRDLGIRTRRERAAARTDQRRRRRGRSADRAARRPGFPDRGHARERCARLEPDRRPRHDRRQRRSTSNRPRAGSMRPVRAEARSPTASARCS